MRTRGSHHVVAGHRGGTSARWRRAAAVAAAAALPLAACAATALPASAAGGYTVTATIGVGSGPQTLLAEQDNDSIRASYPGSTSYRPSSATATFAART
jgi:hypothetical protein